MDSALRPAWFTLSFAMLFAPLLAKTYRTWRIFDNPRMVNVRLSNRTSVLQIGKVVTTAPSPRVPLPRYRPPPPRGSAPQAPIALLYPLLALPCSPFLPRLPLPLPLALPLALPWPYLSPYPNLWACAQWLLLNIVVLALFFGGIGGFSSASTGTYLTENRTMAIPGIAGAEYEYDAWCAPPSHPSPSHPAPGRLAPALDNPGVTLVCAAPNPRLSAVWQRPFVRHHAGGSHAARDSGEQPCRTLPIIRPPTLIVVLTPTLPGVRGTLSGMEGAKRVRRVQREQGCRP